MGGAGDRWRGKVFGWWLRKNGITTDGLSAATQIPRTVIAGLTGGGGENPAFGWSTISYDYVENILKTVSLIKPLDIEELYQLLDIQPSDVKWGKPKINASVLENVPIMIEAGAVVISWNANDPSAPHVYEGKDGIRVTNAEIEAEGVVRLGRLAEISRIENPADIVSKKQNAARVALAPMERAKKRTSGEKKDKEPTGGTE